MSRQGPWQEGYYAPPKARTVAEFDEFGQPVRPGVITWFHVYTACLAGLYLLLAGIMGLASIGVLVDPPENVPADEQALVGVMFLVFTLLLTAPAGVFLAPFFLPRKPWVWIYDIVLIGIGMTSCALWPATIPLLIFWLKPQVQRYYGRAVSGA